MTDIEYEFPPSKDKLLRMLKREEEIRLSDEYINLCSLVSNEIDGWLKVTESIQKMVCYEFGYTNTLDNLLAINYLRSAQYIYPEDPKINMTSLYIRNNKSQDLNLTMKIGDKVPNINIIDLYNNENSLYKLINNNKYNLIIGSSAT